MSYRIIRFYANRRRRVLATNLTWAEATAHCSSPETSSQTARSYYGRSLTRRYGSWFDGFESE